MAIQRMMMMIPAAVATVGLLLGACTTETSGESVAVSSSVASEPQVDKAALNTGSYPTSPAAPYGTATTDNILEIEGQRLAEFVVVPFEIDPELTEVKMPTQVLRSYKNLSLTLGEGQVNMPANRDMLYGFVSTATSATAKATDQGRSVVQMVLRYKDSRQAAAAAQQMHDSLINEPDLAFEEKAEKIDVLPQTLVSTGDTPESGVSINAFTAHGDYVLYTWASAPAAEKDWTAQTVATALTLQEQLIDKFPATPTKEQNGGTAAPLPQIDQDNILLYAIPEEDPNAQGGSDMAVYGPRGMAHRSTNPPLTYNTLTNAGALHNASFKTTVYRAATTIDAQEIVDVFIADLINSDGFTPAPSPPGLPNALCATKDTTDGTQDYCMVVHGRYVGEASGLDNKTDVDQQISAQYLILEQADQDAE
jgi:hypothetical protein